MCVCVNHHSFSVYQHSSFLSFTLTLISLSISVHSLASFFYIHYFLSLDLYTACFRSILLHSFLFSSSTTVISFSQLQSLFFSPSHAFISHSLLSLHMYSLSLSSVFHILPLSLISNASLYFNLF